MDPCNVRSPSETSDPDEPTVTGAEIAPDRLGAAYWWDNIRKPVLFATAIATLTAEGFNTFLEIGPHPILDPYLPFIRDTLGLTPPELVRAHLNLGPKTLAGLSREKPIIAR